VSHDRDFLQGLTQVVYEFKDGQLKEYLGDIDFFLEQRNLSHLRDAEKRSATPKSGKEKSISKNTQDLSPDQKKKKKSLTHKLSKIEREIQVLEAEIQQLDRVLLEGLESVSDHNDFYKQYGHKKSQLETLMAEWESISFELEQH
jgi:ATP-binding cassette subfamily F protein 3